MTSEPLKAQDIVTISDVRLLASANSPCITIALNIPTPLALPLKLKSAVQEVNKKLKDSPVEPHAVESLLAPLHEVAGNMTPDGFRSKNLIVFSSQDLLRAFLLYRPVVEFQSVDRRFHVRPLLSALTREQRFHLLGLSLHGIRLLHCTQYCVEEETKPFTVPRNIQDWMHTRQPDHVLKNRSFAGPGVGSMKGVSFGTNTDQERKGEYISHFFKEVDDGVNTMLRNDTAKLVLAGVDEEVAIYREVSRYPRMFEQTIHGSPDGVEKWKLHKRAMDLVMHSPSEILQKALANFARRDRDMGISSNRDYVLDAAREGRVAELFVSDGAESPGAAGDPLNTAALHTLLHGGRAFVLDENEMPVAGSVAAVLRY